MTYTANGHQGQGFCNLKTAKNTSIRLTIEEVKALHNPRHYYPTHLKGKFGRIGAKGWCQWLGLCCFHSDSKAGSVSINISTGAFKCHSCGASAGDVLDFHGKLHGLTFKETLQALGGGR